MQFLLDLDVCHRIGGEMLEGIDELVVHACSYEKGMRGRVQGSDGHTLEFAIAVFDKGAEDLHICEIRREG